MLRSPSDALRFSSKKGAVKNFRQKVFVLTRRVWKLTI